jgi:hypothetical protein
VKSDLPIHPSNYFNRKSAAVSLTWMIGLVFCIGCGSKQVVVIPDYDNEYYRGGELIRPAVEVVETIDARRSSPDQVGTAKVGMFNSRVPYLLSEPASEFITNSVNTMLGADPQAERICPVTVRIDALAASEKTGAFSENGTVDCQLRFSFPVSADSTSVTSVSAVSKDGSMFDVTSSLERLLYESVMTCTKQFLVDSYDPAPSHLLVDRADAPSAADIGLRANQYLGVVRTQYSAESGSLEDPSENAWNRMGFLYHYFLGEEMQDAYSSGYGFTYKGGGSLDKNFCFGFEISLLMASGTPVERPTSTWVVNSSALTYISMPIIVSLMYPPLGDREGSLRPYAGIGGGGMLGVQHMQAELSNIVAEVEAGSGEFLVAWMGEVVLGTEFGQWAASPFVEFRLVMSGRCSVYHGLSEEEQEQFDETIYNALVRPDGRMTGGQLCLGFRW